MDLQHIQNEKRFLGQEFLTWLWWISEEEGQIDLIDGTSLEIMLADRMSLRPVAGADGARVSLRGKEARLAEARHALRAGKLVDRLRLGLTIDGEDYWLTLDATELAIGALRTPAMAPAEGGREGRDALTLERIALIETAVRALDGLYRQYLAGRMATATGGEDWERMRAWAAAQA